MIDRSINIDGNVTKYKFPNSFRELEAAIPQ